MIVFVITFVLVICGLLAMRAYSQTIQDIGIGMVLMGIAFLILAPPIDRALGAM